MGECPLIRSVKICGVTDLTIAEQCVRLGFGAIGFVFYEESPRNMTPEAVRAITRRLPEPIAKVGVFVDRSPEEMLDIAEEAGLTTLQLHGNEGTEVVEAVSRSRFHVVKVARSVPEACDRCAALPAGVSLLLECGRGVLPGGNGLKWNWADARNVGMPVGIAGGLSPENICAAVSESGAVAYDVSSGVESAPGVKDPAAISRLAEAVASVSAPAVPFWRKAVVDP